MHGFGGVVSIELHGGQEAVNRFIDRTQLLTRAASLGSVEALITQPIAAVHHNVPARWRALGGITENLIRIAVGIKTLRISLAT